MSGFVSWKWLPGPRTRMMQYELEELLKLKLRFETKYRIFTRKLIKSNEQDTSPNQASQLREEDRVHMRSRSCQDWFSLVLYTWGWSHLDQTLPDRYAGPEDCSSKRKVFFYSKIQESSPILISRLSSNLVPMMSRFWTWWVLYPVGTFVCEMNLLNI